MVDIRPVDESELADFRRLHNTYVGRNESLETVRQWHREHPELLVGAYDDGQLVGHCLGIPRSGDEVELNGIAVDQSHRRQGIGTALLSAFEDLVASLGFQRVSLGSAGGYVDEFYVQNGYSPDSILVRLDPGEDPPDYTEVGYEIRDERLDGDLKKLYVGTDEYDPGFVEEIQEVFEDPEAIYIMSKKLDAT